MPLYICGAPPDRLDDRQRRQIAARITEIHCDVTGAPPIFAHVIFDESKAEYSIFGTIRAGRSEETKTELKQRMARAVAETVGVDAGEVSAITVDVPASWVMEGGALLPEPGEEGDWLAAHAPRTESR